MVVDATLLAAALHKLFDGGWFPLVLATAMCFVMLTWRRGRGLLLSRLRGSTPPLMPFLEALMVSPPQRVAGTAIFLNSASETTPHALLHSLKHYKVLHERNVFLTVEYLDEPFIQDSERLTVEQFSPDCWRVAVRYGFLDRPDISLALELAAPYGLFVEPMDISYFLSREKIVFAARDQGMAHWRDRLFAAMARNAGSVTDYFNIPTNRVVELGTRVEI